MTLKNFIQDYHDMLAAGTMAEDSQAQLDDQQRRRGLFFGQRPLTTVLRPRLMTYQQYQYVLGGTRGLLSAFDKIHQAALANAEFRAQFDLFEWEEELVRHDPGFNTPTPISRLDAFYIPESGDLWFTEYNAETPAAPAYNDTLTDVFYALPIMRQFLRKYELRSLPARHGVLHALTDAFEQWAGTRREAPRIAILDWREVPTYSEFVLFEQYFHSQGIECIIADPVECEYRDGKLMVGDFHINLIFKRVLIGELIERGGMQHPVVRAVLDNAVCMVNPFSCKMLYKKASLAVLSDEQNAHLFTQRELASIHSHIPWTRRVEERHTTYKGLPVDLLPFILKYRRQLVLKPNDDYGGHGIVLGWTVSDVEWSAALKHALTTPYIVQERVPVPAEPYPSLINGNLHVIDRMLDTDPFIFHGDTVYGCLTRLSTADLLNVTAGGGSTVPTFVVEKR